MEQIARIYCFKIIFVLVLLATVPVVSYAAAYGPADQVEWRIRFLEAAIVSGPNVKLGEIAVPTGNMPDSLWEQLAERELWPSPPNNGKAVSMTRPRIQEVVVRTMNDLAPYCLFPGAIALQRGGAVVGKEQIKKIVVDGLKPLLGGLPGEGQFQDFRIPQYIFLKHAGQQITVEPQKKIAPGRISFRIIVKELDDSIVQKISCSVFIDVWTEVPCATAPLNKDDILEASNVTHIRVNLAHLRETPWDGRGGPWKVLRSIGVQQVIYQSDLGHIPTIRKGAIVNLVYEGKTFRLSLRGEAMSDGVTGESIAVKNLESKTQVYGVVRDGTTVIVNKY